MTNTATKNSPGFMIYLAGLSMLGFLAIDMYLPAFGAMQTSLNTSEGAISASLSIFLAGALFYKRFDVFDKIVSIAEKTKIPFQLEVEGMGSSDGGELQRSHLPIDWCFVGAPELNAHTPHEKVNKFDVETMFALYDELMKKL